MKAKRLQQADIMQWLESQFSTSERGNASIEWQYSQVSRQNGSAIIMLASLLGDHPDTARDQYREIILGWKKDREERLKPKGAR